MRLIAPVRLGVINRIDVSGTEAPGVERPQQRGVERTTGIEPA